MKTRVLAIFLFLVNFCFAQFTDNFTDGDFSANPAWTPLAPVDFVVTTGQLQSNNTTASSTFYITTPSTTASNCQWEFFVNLKFATSGSNYVDVYLTADNSDLTAAALNGYFVRIGNTLDEICLYKNVAGTASKIIDGADAIVSSGTNNLIKIKVTRDASDLFDLQRDMTGTGGSYVSEGTITDATFATSSFFGILIKQSTASFFQKHFFDDFYVGSIITDTNPPGIVSASVISSTQLDVLFDENLDATTSQTAANYTANNGLGNPASAVQDGTDLKLVHLTFAAPFTNGLQNTLTVNGVEDLLTNAISNGTVNFTYLSFSTPGFGDVIVNEIMVDVNPVPVGVPAKQFVELYNTTSNYYDLNGWQISDAVSTATVTTSYTLAPNSYVIIAKASDTALFTGITNKIGASTFPTFNTSGDPVFLRDNSSNYVDSIRYTTAWYNDVVKDDGGWSLELINPTVSAGCSVQSNWTASNDVDGGTPGIQNSVYNTTPDAAGPAFVSVSVVDSMHLELCFNEAIDAVVATTTTNYTVDNGIGNPSTAVADASGMCITLTFPVNFQSAVNYTVNFPGLTDCSGNAVTIGSAGFVYYQVQTPAYKDVIINEIMVDVSPVPAGVPAKQYLELYNNSSKYFDLNGWQFADAATTTTISTSYLLAPNTYVLICKSTDTALFTGINNKVGTNTFPSFNVSGDPVFLYGTTANVLDSIRYTTAWYNDLTKDDGGWSLELINPNVNPGCTAQGNWTATNDLDGGTPGVQNSVYSIAPDVTSPGFSSIVVMDSMRVQLCFNEAIDAATLTTASNYSVNNGVGSPLTAVANSSNTCVTLTFAASFPTSLSNTITFASLADCSGNMVNPNNTTFTYYQISNPVFGDVILTEIMVDVTPAPVGVPAKQYIELYNKSSKYFDLNGWQFADAASISTISGNYVFAPNSYVLICKSTDTTLFTGITNRIGTSTFPSYNISGDPFYLFDNSANSIDSIRYTTAWYNDLTKDDGGWSLELINPTVNNNCSAQANWTASNNSNGGTPGAQNSVYSIAPDVTAPAFVSSVVIDSVTLQLCFNEAISNALITNTSSYSVNGGVGSPSSVVVDATSTCATLSFTTSFIPQTTYTVTFSSLTDCSGNAVTPNNVGFIYFQTSTPNYGDVILTEIMVDVNPVPVSAPAKQYIELYNKSANYFNLNGWQFADASSTSTISTNYILAPGNYVVLCKLTDTASFSAISNKIATSTFPSYNISGDPVYLYDNSSNPLDSIRYTTSWYNDLTKDDGGWSLELINPTVNTNCYAQSNWTASNDVSGGTPGLQNSVYSISPDVTAPVFNTISVLDSVTIELCFNEAILSSLMSNPPNYIVTGGIGSPASVVLNANGTCATLNFATAFTAQTSYTVSFATLTDCSGNFVTPTSSSFTYFQTSVAAYNDVIITEMMIDVNPAPAAVPATQYIELFNKSTKYFNLNNWQLSDAVGSNSVNSNYIFAPNTYVVLTKLADTNLFIGIANKVGLSSMPTFNTTGDAVYIQDGAGNFVDSLRYTDDWYLNATKKAGGYSLELINPTLNANCDISANWMGTNSLNGGTPGAQNSVYNVSPDVTGPQPMYVSVSDSVHITVCFNEAISSNLINATSSYLVSGGIGNPISATISSTDTKCIDLVLSLALQNQTNYVLSLNTLADCSGNVVNPDSVVFSYYVAKPFDVVINEIFADPDPQVALPAGEYIELYNRTNYSVSLKDWVLTIGNKDVIIPDAVIQPDSFLVIIDDASLNAFINEGYGGIALLQLSDLSSNELNVSDEDIILKDKYGNVISYVHYYDSWYGDAVKKAGGWSLEQIDASNPCAGSTNWRASVNGNGGTPGSVNSINASNPDNAAPEVLRVNVIDADTIAVMFNESMLYTSLGNASSYSVNNSIGTPVAVYPIAQDYVKVILVLASPLQANVVYTLTVSNTVYDCAGNLITSANTAEFGLPQAPAAGDLVINELLFNPKSGGVDFVELYNNSNKIIDLRDVYIGEGSATSSIIIDSVQITSEGYQIFPQQYVVLSENGNVVKSQYATENPKWFLDMSNLPSMNTTDDIVVIADISGNEIDKVAYTDKMHFALLNDVKGVSLERIDFNRASNDATNWNSAAANVGFGTPAYLNSQYLKAESTGTFSVNPEIFSPDNDGYNDVVTINYTVAEPGMAGNVTIYDSRGALIKRLVKNENLATEGSYSWNGITEQNEKAPMGIYVIYFETFSTSGKIEKHKLTCVLANKM